MISRRLLLVYLTCLALVAGALHAQTPAQSQSSSSPSSSSASSLSLPPTKHAKKPAAATDAELDDGAVTNGVYRNKSLGLACKIPPGWVLRTDEMNAREGNNGEE